MTVLIQEVVIRATAERVERSERAKSEPERRAERAQLVEDAVAEVMRILRRKEEP